MGVERRLWLGTFHVNNISPTDSHPPNIRTRDLHKLDYGAPHLIETPYAGGFRYWEGVGFVYYE